MTSNSTSNAVGDLTNATTIDIVGPRWNGSNNDDDDNNRYNRTNSDPGCRRGSGLNDSSDNDTSARVVGGASDSDGLQQTEVQSLLVCGAVLLVVLLIVFLWRRKRRAAVFEPTPAVLLHFHARLESPQNDLQQPMRKRGSTAETAASTDDHRASLTGLGRRHSSCTPGDAILLTSAWVDPVIESVRIPLHEITIDRVIGRGGFGEVYRGKYNHDHVAIKTLHTDRRKDLVHIEALLAEVRTISSLDHPNIVKFIGVAWDALSDLCVVMELLDGGDLRSLLHTFERVDHRPRGFGAVKTRIALDVVQALEYLHSLDPVVMHRDIKSRNVLLDRHNHAKLADFGVVRRNGGGLTTTANGVGSSLWMAPEVMLGEKYDAKADIYSFGVLLSEIDTHLSPYWHVREPQPLQNSSYLDPASVRKIPDTAAILHMVWLDKVRLKFTPSTSAATHQLIELALSCVSKNPAQRPSATQLRRKMETIYQSMQMTKA